MDSKQWKTRIVKEMKQAQTYQPFFISAIETLADILATRDKAREQFEGSGGSVIVKHTNKGGATNLEKNPALVAMVDLNRDALQYWRELGLTPKGLKAIDEASMKGKEQSAFGDALDKILGGG